MKIAGIEDIKKFIKSQNEIFKNPPYYDTLSNYHKKQIIYAKKSDEGPEQYWDIEWNLSNKYLAICPICNTKAPVSVDICPACGEIFN